MRVLMITPRVDEEHDILGFIVTWINKLAERVDKLYVITINSGKANLRKNVELYSLDKKSSKIAKIFYFKKLIVKILPKVDIIFCHMYPEFTIFISPWAKFIGIPIVQWYAHGTVSWKLRLAHILADRIVTSSKDGCRIRSNKVIVIGQGIDTDKFKPIVKQKKQKKKDDKIIILSVGRISPIKNFEILIKAADILVNERGMKDIVFIIVGGIPLSSHREYYKNLIKIVKKCNLDDYVKFIGPVPYTRIVEYYQNCDIFISTSQTGSLDKTVLEAMACEKPVIVCNEAFKSVLGSYSRILMFNKRDPYDLVNKIVFILKMDDKEREKLCSFMRKIVKEKHNIDSLMNKLIKLFEGLKK